MGLIILIGICGGFGLFVYLLTKAVMPRSNGGYPPIPYVPDTPEVKEAEVKPLTEAEWLKFERWRKESLARIRAAEIQEELKAGIISQEIADEWINQLLDSGYLKELGKGNY